MNHIVSKSCLFTWFIVSIGVIMIYVYVKLTSINSDEIILTSVNAQWIMTVKNFHKIKKCICFQFCSLLYKGGNICMSNEGVKYYENYREEDRITTNNARRIEFLTTCKYFDELFYSPQKILDCAAGTGAYAFRLAEQGHDVTATDITPRHIEYINNHLKDKNYHMETAVLDATDMSIFVDESFDVVLNMGPFYHLTSEDMRSRCFAESLRVLKKGGYLVIAYIPRLYLNQMIAMTDTQYVDKSLLNQIRNTGVLKSDDPKCFWTDTYYSSFEEMQQLYKEKGLTIEKHFAQDGISPMFHKIVDAWSEEQFKTWYNYHLSVCEEKSIIDMSNHVVTIGRKNDLK